MPIEEKGAVAPALKDSAEESYYPIIQDEGEWGKQADFAFTLDNPEAYPEEMEAAIRQAEEYVARLIQTDPYCIGVLSSYTSEVAEFPYSHDLKTGGILYRWIAFATDEGLAKSDSLTGGGASRYKAFCNNLRSHYTSVMCALNELKAISYEHGLTEDEFGNISVESIGADIEQSIRDAKESGLSVGYRSNMVGGEKPVPFINIRHSQDMFNILHRLCELGLENEIRRILKRPIVESAGNEEPEELSLIDFAITKRAVDHSYANKGFSCLIDIARSSDGREIIKPSRGNTSESVAITATPALAQDYLQYEMANWRYLSVVTNTIDRIRRETAFHSKGYFYKGRFWISTNKLLEEISRTANGTVKQPSRKKKRRDKLHAALKLLGSANIEYTQPNGEVGIFAGLIDGGVEYRAEVKCHGNVIKDAWGFMPNPSPLSEYTLNAGYVYDYDQLQVPPYEEGNVWIPEYLYDLLREMRRDLYTKDKGGTLKQKTNKKTHRSRLWSSIFSEADPLRGESLRPEKKAEIVKDFEEILKAIAEKEAKGENHHGAPMYIKARSKRDKGRGRGKGAWVSLEIEAFSTLHKVDIELS